MSNYIDKDTFQKFLEDEIEETKCDMKNSYGDEYYEMAVESRECALREVLSKLKREPMADVQEVKHGHWIEQAKIKKDGEVRLVHWQCSLCGCFLGTNTANYCPACGAKMDGEE